MVRFKLSHLTYIHKILAYSGSRHQTEICVRKGGLGRVDDLAVGLKLIPKLVNFSTEVSKMTSVKRPQTLDMSIAYFSYTPGGLDALPVNGRVSFRKLKPTKALFIVIVDKMHRFVHE